MNHCDHMHLFWFHRRAVRFVRVGVLVVGWLGGHASAVDAADPRPRVIVETDAGGDPDDEQSLVRFLLYTNDLDVEGIIANREPARDGENLNRERTGLGIVRAQVKAYGECYPRLREHDKRYPSPEQLLARTVPGYDHTDDGVQLVLAAVDRADPRPVWFLNWGTDHGAAVSCLRRALDRVRKDRGQAGYAAFKSKLRLSSDDQFGDHTWKIEPPFALWVDTFRPELERRRWYHRFSALTEKAGGFDVRRDVLTGHGPLGALYPLNTTHPQKEGDTMTFLYLIPTGMNDPSEPTWGSWAGRYGPREGAAPRKYYWANQRDAWHGRTHRDQTVARWAADFQNDFRARLDWCVQPWEKANHAPRVVLNGDDNGSPVTLRPPAGSKALLDATGSRDPDGDPLSYEWFIYREAGTYQGDVKLDGAVAGQAVVAIPADAAGKTIHVLVTVRDDGQPPLARYRRAVLHVQSPRVANP